jgi:hypothetical protein
MFFYIGSLFFLHVGGTSRVRVTGRNNVTASFSSGRKKVEKMEPNTRVYVVVVQEGRPCQETVLVLMLAELMLGVEAGSGDESKRAGQKLAGLKTRFSLLVLDKIEGCTHR